MAKLIGMSGDFKGREFPLQSGTTTVGRKSDSDILLDHPTISSHHCRIVFDGSTCTLQDLGSTNGSRVNSRHVQEAELHNKDLLQFGSIEFMLDAPEVAAAAPRYVDGDAEVAAGGLDTPQDFGTISPFGEPPQEKVGLWLVLLSVLGVLGILAVVVFLAVLFVF